VNAFAFVLSQASTRVSMRHARVRAPQAQTRVPQFLQDYSKKNAYVSLR
jgi:hypothetical protein